MHENSRQCADVPLGSTGVGAELMRGPVRVMHLNPALRADGPGRGMLALMRYLPRQRVWSEACSLSRADPAMESLLRGHGIPHRCRKGRRRVGLGHVGQRYQELVRALVGRDELEEARLHTVRW